MLTVTGATAVNAGAGAVTLANTGNNFGSFGAIGGAVSVPTATPLTLGCDQRQLADRRHRAGNGA